MTTAQTPEPQLELIHVHHNETGLAASHATWTALATWIQQAINVHNANATPPPGEVDAIENPLSHLLKDERTQMVRPAGRMKLVGMLYAISRKAISPPPPETDDADPERLRRLAGELATTIRCLHYIRENDYVLFVIE